MAVLFQRLRGWERALPLSAWVTRNCEPAIWWSALGTEPSSQEEIQTGSRAAYIPGER